MLQWCILWDWLKKVKGGREVCHPSQIEQAGWLAKWLRSNFDWNSLHQDIHFILSYKILLSKLRSKAKKGCIISSQLQITDITRENKSAQHLLSSVQVQTKKGTRAATPEPTLSLAGLFQQVLGFAFIAPSHPNATTQAWWELCRGLSTSVGTLEPGTQPCSS